VQHHLEQSHQVGLGGFARAEALVLPQASCDGFGARPSADTCGLLAGSRMKQLIRPDMLTAASDG
jgi:hypothetical protein